MANSGRFPKDPPPEEDGTVYTAGPEYIKRLLSDTYSGESFGKASSFAGMTDEDIQGLSDSIQDVRKVGVKLPMTWEALAESQRKGHYEPVGNKYTQWAGWWIGKQVFRFWQFVERRLQRFRHYREVSGYDWEEAEYRGFEQRTQWVENEVQGDDR